MAKPAILHLIHGLTVGGAEVDLLHKSAALTADYGYDVTIACLMRRGELADEAEARGIRVLGPFMTHRYDATAVFKLRRLMMAYPLVHTHLFAANFIGHAIAATIPLGKRPLLLAAEHAMAERWGRHHLWIDRAVQHLTQYILVPSQTAADSYAQRGLSSTKLRVLPNGIPLQSFQSVDKSEARQAVRREWQIADETILLGVVSRLEKVKNLSLLLQVGKLLPVHILIVGDGPERERLAEEAEAYGMAARVHFTGRRADVPRLLAAMDMFVLPSRSESFGIAVAEALLMGTPVVATAVGAIPEITGQGEFARLVPPGDVLALQTTVSEALGALDAAKRQAEQGAAFISGRYSLATAVARQHALYQQLLNGD